MRTYTNEELVALMNAAPKPVQEAIESKNTPKTISEIGTRLKLHIDQIGEIASLTFHMLVGSLSPTEFRSELTALGLQETEVKLIMSEINQKIFVPLQQKMRQGGVGEGRQPTVASQQPMQRQAQPIPAPRPVQPQMQPSRPAPPQPLQPQMQRSLPQPPLQKMVTPPPNLPGAEPERLLPDHEVGHIEVASRQDMQRTTPPAPRPPVANIFPQPIAPPVTSSQAQTREATPPGLPPLTKYNKDPYREIVDDGSK